MGFDSLEAKQLRKFHLKLNILSGSGTFLDGFDIAVIGVALPYLTKNFSLNPFMTGLVASSLLIGNILGTVVFGRVTDRIGRQKMYVIDLLSFVVFAALAAVSTNVWELLGFRFLLGVSVGADYAVSPTLIAEFNPTAKRGGRVAFLTLTFFIGSLASYLIGLAMAPIGPSAWRYMLLMGAVIALVVFFLRRQIPESPRWLASTGDTKKAAAVIRELTSESQEVQGAKASLNWRDLFSKKMAQRTFFVCIFWFAWDVTYYGVSLFSPTMLSNFKHTSPTIAILGASSITIVSIISTLIGMLFLYDKWGRRPVLILGFVGMAVALLVLALNPKPSFMFLVILLDLGIFLGTVGPGTLPWVYATDLFPTGLRASGTGLAAAAGKVGGILGVLVFPKLVSLWGNGHSAYLFVVISVIGAFIAIFMAPETKGKSLENIETQFSA